MWRNAGCASLPCDIKLKRGGPRIEFFGAEDLAAKLLEFSKAVSNDWAAFARAVEDGGKEAAAAAIAKFREFAKGRGESSMLKFAQNEVLTVLQDRQKGRF